eukprot:1156841-Pelagomonas_calceolata.AAC.4
MHARGLAVGIQALSLQLAQAGAQRTTGSRGIRAVGPADLAHATIAVYGDVGEAEEDILQGSQSPNHD